ncbi:putative HTH-type transcriptional regulator YbbH [Collinsella sp. AK_207A]|uniref:MurR/RpiR family transcriptional regulator n=1 Tax=Collinsella sp. AK_207A TaxID=2650472 RepID=UPI001260CF10|nr:MurR/RpiR family transcriptional regulator [Collinsella sp. AK_207A]VWL91900.1 putative HTH-type transcriptional regulator YbbH [Collinsella sp. AK_207A]
MDEATQEQIPAVLNPEDILSRLQAMRHSCGPSEDALIGFLLDNPEVSSHATIRSLSHAAFVSPATIIRTCKRAGYQGFKDFKRAMLLACAARNAQLTEMQEGILPQDSVNVIVQKVTARTIRAVEDTARLVSLSSLMTCSQLILTRARIGIFGIGESQLVAQDLKAKLLRINLTCNAEADWHNQLLIAKNMTETDLAIAISYSGMTPETANCAHEAHRRGASVIAITSEPVSSRLAKESDVTLQTVRTEPEVRSGALTSRMSQLQVVDMLYTVCINTDRDRLTKIIIANSIKKQSDAASAVS